MKRHQLIITLLIAAGTFLLNACGEKSMLPDGNIVGYVFTFNEYNKVLDDHSGVRVSTTGSKREYVTTTDKYGRFELEDIPAGTYKFTFEKQGFGTLKQFGIRHLGGEPTVLGMPFSYSGSTYFLFETPTSEILDLSISGNTLSCSFSFTKPPPDVVRLHLYFSAENNFNISAPAYEIVANPRPSGNIYTTEISLGNSAFTRGTTLYYRACVDAYTGGGIRIGNSMIVSGIINYFDYDENMEVFPSLGSPSSQYSFIYGE